MRPNALHDIEEEILNILQKNRKDYLAVSQVVSALPRNLRKYLGLTARAEVGSALQKLRPYLGNRLQVYKNARVTYVGKIVPLTELVFNYIRANPNLSPALLAQRLPMPKANFIQTLNQLLEEGNVLCTFKIDYRPFLRVLEAPQAPMIDERSVFKAAYQAVGKGKSFVDIHRVRGYLGWPREQFDAVLNELRCDYTIQLHGGDPSTMTEKEIQGSYLDENNILYLTMTWKRK